MTQTQGAATSRLREAGATAQNKGWRARRRFSVVPIALLLSAALLMPQSALAAESTSGYSQTVPTPKTTSTTPSPTPTTGTSPSKEEKEKSEKSGTSPAKETSPSSSSTTSSGTSSKSGTLPFTGLDLRLVLGGGLLLMGAGFSLLVADRRLRRKGSR